LELPEYPPEITQRLLGTPEQSAASLVREPPNGWRPVVLVDYDPAWPQRFAVASRSLRELLGGRVIDLEHVGSTSVPGLAAKSIIDIDLTIADTEDESSYVPTLEGAGYWLILREPWWYGHRMLVDAEEDIHLHVWPQGAPEPVRHRLFRDWLRSHPDDRDLYAATKRRLAEQDEKTGDDYTFGKSDVIDEIFARIFAAAAQASQD
jgi:GrpB-like predicted nucleotidyltransferase (UPF0157 family)